MKEDLMLGLVRYATNHVIAKIPIYAVRHAWYRKVLGMRIGAGSALLMDLYLYIRGRARPGQNGITIGRRTVINQQCCLDRAGRAYDWRQRGRLAGGLDPDRRHDMNDPLFPEVLAPVRIGNHVWIGSRAIFCRGFLRGRGSCGGGSGRNGQC